MDQGPAKVCVAGRNRQEKGLLLRHGALHGNNNHTPHSTVRSRGMVEWNKDGTGSFSPDVPPDRTPHHRALQVHLNKLPAQRSRPPSPSPVAGLPSPSIGGAGPATERRPPMQSNAPSEAERGSKKGRNRPPQNGLPAPQVDRSRTKAGRPIQLRTRPHATAHNSEHGQGDRNHRPRWMAQKPIPQYHRRLHRQVQRQ